MPASLGALASLSPHQEKLHRAGVPEFDAVSDFHELELPRKQVERLITERHSQDVRAALF